MSELEHTACLTKDDLNYPLCIGDWDICFRSHTGEPYWARYVINQVTKLCDLGASDDILSARRMR